jgi:hypothetical protein
MKTHHTERGHPALQALPNGTAAVLAAAPALERENGDSKKARRARKEELKRYREAERRPDAWERFRILIEVVSEGRQVVEIADHKARYALVVGGVLNAAVFAILAGGHVVRDLAPAVKPWLAGALALYGMLICWFVLNAIDCLRPRKLNRAVSDRPPESGWAAEHRPLGLLVWEAIVGHDPADLQAAWDRVRMTQINAEVVAVSRVLAGLIQAKYRALHRLYAGLVVMVVISMGILAAGVYLLF